ncbi:MAG: DUF4352 domain-containing protein [Candidatus Bipolaricaulota bacterium]|nr:DUF4352 domain-containing protein [Candidatus Bipolaricaulota bacterium]MDW8030652.1 hypothetical protein [Candidatus Bipolaricaulota bacterium]
MHIRVIIALLCIIGVIGLFWYIGHYRRPEPSELANQIPLPPRPSNLPSAPTMVAHAAPRDAQNRAEPCPRDRTDNGMLQLSLRSVSTAKQLGPWVPAPGRIFVIIEVVLEAITDFQLASSAVLWLEEPDGTERTRSVATGALPRPLLSLSPFRGEGVSGQVAFEINAQVRDVKLHYDPFLARQLTLCVSVP